VPNQGVSRPISSQWRGIEVCRTRTNPAVDRLDIIGIVADLHAEYPLRDFVRFSFGMVEAARRHKDGMPDLMHQDCVDAMQRSAPHLRGDHHP
jgi:hypothetical protein